MNGTPCLSVIVANYNNEQYIAECLDSVLAQTFKDLEIVVFDDGSSDGSLEWLENFQRKYPNIITVIHDSVNRGAAYARHQAILASRGEHITTLDSDDYYGNPLKLEKEMALIRHFKEKEKKEVLSFSNVLLVKDRAQPCLWGNSETILQGWIGERILCRSCFIPRDFVMRREAYFQEGGYDPRFEIYEDWDLKIRLAIKHEFHYTGDVGSAYRLHGQGLSSRPFVEQIPVLRAVFEKNLPLAAAGNRKRIRHAFNEWIADASGENKNPAP